MPRVGSVATVWGALALCCACGGRASEREVPVEPLGAPDSAEVAVPAEQLPSLPPEQGPNRGIELLELRRSDESGATEAAALGCMPDGYSLRLEVDLQRHELVSEGCEATPDYKGYSRYGKELLDDEFARIEQAYLALRVVTAEQCIPADEVLTLELSPEHGEPLLYGDEKHSGCPVPGFERERYVTGLDELLRVLESIPVL